MFDYYYYYYYYLPLSKLTAKWRRIPDFFTYLKAYMLQAGFSFFSFFLNNWLINFLVHPQAYFCFSMTLWVSASRVTWLSWAWVSHGGRADFGGCGVCCPDDGCAVRGRSHFHCEPLFYSQHCTMSLRFEDFISNASLLMAGARSGLHLGCFSKARHSGDTHCDGLFLSQCALKQGGSFLFLFFPWHVKTCIPLLQAPKFV